MATNSPPAAHPAPVAETATKAGMFVALHVRDFRVLLLGSTLSNAAQWIQQVTLGWLVYELTGSGTALGTINLVRSIASLGLTPVAGAAIDRVARRPLMMATNAWLLAISLILGLSLLSGRQEVWHLFVFAFLAGAGQTFDMPLRQTATFDLVPRALAPNAVALIQTGWSLMRSVGPALGGALILIFGPGGNFLVQASAYALIAVSILWIRFPHRVAHGRANANVFRTMSEGIQYIAKERTTRTFVLMG